MEKFLIDIFTLHSNWDGFKRDRKPLSDEYKGVDFQAYDVGVSSDSGYRI